MLFSFAHFHLFFLFPLVTLVTLYSTKDFFSKTVSQGQRFCRTMMFVCVTIGFTALLSWQFIQTGAGLPYDIRGNWLEKEGVLLEWAQSPRYKHDATLQTSDGTLNEYYVMNMMRDTDNAVPAGFSVRFLVKGNGSDDIYITAYHQPGNAEWSEVPVRFPSPEVQAASYQSSIAFLFLEILALLIYTVWRKGPPWRFQRWVTTGTLLLLGSFASAGLFSIYNVNAYARGEENASAVRLCFSVVGVVITLIYLWIIVLDLWYRQGKMSGITQEAKKHTER